MPPKILFASLKEVGVKLLQLVAVARIFLQ